MRPPGAATAASRRHPPSERRRKKRRAKAPSSARVAAREVPEAATVCPQRPKLAIAMQHLEHPLEAVERAGAVRVPPGHGDPPPVRVKELDVRDAEEPVPGGRPAEPRLLAAAPRPRTHAVRVAEVVRPRHSRLDARGKRAGAGDVAGPDARAEPEARRVGQPYRLV